MIDPLDEAITRLLPHDGGDFALAFSGGSDSLGLLHALKDHPRLAAVVHVDHGLRSGSADEARRARELAKALGHELMVLSWKPDSVTSAIQEKARKARYGLMGTFCRTLGVSTLVTAHHDDDQAETVLMRLQSGSGWRGAAGMRERRYAPVWPELAGITLVRPALSISRKALSARINGQTPTSDPSNQNRRFFRVRARDELLQNHHLKDEMIALAGEMQSGRDIERRLIAQSIVGAHLTHEGLLTVPRLVSAPALAIIAPIIGGQERPANRERLKARLSDLRCGTRVSIGCGAIADWNGRILTVSRDPVSMTGRRNGSLPPSATPYAIGPEPFIWDGRFMVQGQGGIMQPERRGAHVGYRVLYGRNVRVENLVEQRLQAALTGM